MIEDFKRKLKENGQSLRWFYAGLKSKGVVTVSYGGFNHQINGHATLPEEVKKEIQKYMKSKPV